jgi:hypothetical protein
MQKQTYYIKVNDKVLSNVDSYSENELIAFINNSRIKDGESKISYYRHVTVDNNQGKIIEDVDETLEEDTITSDVDATNKVVKRAVSMSNTIRNFRSGMYGFGMF